MNYATANETLNIRNFLQITDFPQVLLERRKHTRKNP